MAAIAVADADELAGDSADGEQAGGGDGVVVCAEVGAFGANGNAQSGGGQDEDEDGDGDAEEGWAGVVLLAR